ncbi:MAG: helix-turn-helix domain-containing protein [Oscillospiraceae bacterium]|nr:helix-turn-helix domain-containing protein [Oscillospiraceae bacterium]
MKFGDVLRQLIECHDLTQKQLGIDLNISPSTIGNYVNNTREPDYATLKTLAKYFGVSTDYMLNYHSDNCASHNEDLLIKIYRNLNETNKEILIKQAQVLYNVQNK